MNKDRKIVYHMIPAYELAVHEEYFQEMARKGWMFDGFVNQRFSFHRIEPKELYFYVDIFDKASVFDTRAEEETLDYIEFCENAGWNYICTNGKYQVFYTEKEKSIPIQTDQKQRFSLIMKCSFWKSVFGPIMAILCTFSYLYGIGLDLVKRVITLFDIQGVPYLSMFAVWSVVGLLYLWQFVCLIDFVARNLIHLKCGKPLFFHSKKLIDFSIIISRALSFVAYVFAVLGLSQVSLIFLLIGTLLPLTFFAISFINVDNSKRKDYSRERNKKQTIVIVFLGVLVGCSLPFLLVSFVFKDIGGDQNYLQYERTDENGDIVTYYYSKDEIPYTLEDAGYSMKNDRYRDTAKIKTKGILCTDECYMDSYSEELDEDWIYSIQYEKLKFKSKTWCDYWIQLLLNNKELHFEEQKDIAKKWNANAAYYKIYDYEGATQEDTEIYILYDDYCYILSFNMDKPEIVKKIFE